MSIPTALEVVDGIDLSNTTAIVTGGHSGIGLETSRALAAAGAHVIVGSRDPAAARAALDERFEVIELGLADLTSVRAFATTNINSGRPIDILMANAGIMAVPETRIDPGWESQFAVNHLGHFALVDALWPALTARGARVVVTASGMSEIRWHDVQFENGYDKWEAYGQSKTANRLFALEVDRRGAASGVRGFSATPGYILTPLQRHLELSEMVDAGWVDESGVAVHPAFISPAQGAATQVWGATSPALDGLGGLHLEEVAMVGPIGSVDDAERLWALSADLVAGTHQ
jgi:NAD(P)-dependent dehydrogenase (short-subunit alcohol dehydrogenase family)